MANWLYEEAGNIILPDQQLCDKITEELHVPAQAFIENVSRIRAFWGLNPHLVEVASINVQLMVETVQALTGKPFLNQQEMADPQLRQKITDEAERRITERVKTAGSLEAATGYSFARGLDKFGELLRLNPEMDEAISATFSAQVTSAWTAVETLASDLWEAVINYHPQTLATLRGIKERISKKAGSTDRDRRETGERLSGKEEFEPTLRDFERITYGNYNASELMGTLLRENFSFQRLAGIRVAYSRAFSKNYDELDEILADHAFDKLNLVRNLLLHKAGIVDDIFIKGVDSLSWTVGGERSLQPEEEKPLVLTGQIVKELINPAFQCAERLIKTVDTWVRRN
jgi:hypothetical protein